ncbi:unnamed protein product, partial [Closterium sp. Naga37s-1]
LLQQTRSLRMAAGSSDSKGAVFLESEIEFIAENELVSIVPNFRADALHLHAGDIGPFRPQIALQVPLWLAIALKKRAKCSIQPPPWLAAGDPRPHPLPRAVLLAMFLSQ